MKRHSLLFGVQDYPGEGELTPLKCPHADVDALGDLLSDPRFMGEVGQVTIVKDPTYGVARQTFRAFFREVGPEDVAIIHFSGHGLRDDAGDLFLCFTDAEEDDLELTALNVTRLGEWLEKKRLRRTLITLDCCYSGAAGAQMTRDSVAAQLRSVERQRPDGTGLYILSSAGATETAKEGNGRGVFSHHLIEGIRTGAADTNGDGDITVSEIAEYLQREVPKDAVRQTPHLTAHKVAGTFVVARNPIAIEEEARQREAAAMAVRAGERAALAEAVGAKLRDHMNFGSFSISFGGEVETWLSGHPVSDTDDPRLALLRDFSEGRLAAVDFHERWRKADTPPAPEPAPERPWARRVAPEPAEKAGPTPMERAAARAAAASGSDAGDASEDRPRGGAAEAAAANRQAAGSGRKRGFFSGVWKLVIAAIYGAIAFFAIASEGAGLEEAVTVGVISFGVMWLFLSLVAWIVRVVKRIRSAAARRMRGGD